MLIRVRCYQPYVEASLNGGLGMYSKLCVVEADFSRLSNSITPRSRASDGQRYYVLKYEMVLSFGLTELTAQICWEEQVSRLSKLLVYHSYRL